MSEQDKMRQMLVSSVRKSKATAKPKAVKAAPKAAPKAAVKTASKPAAPKIKAPTSPRKKPAPETTTPSSCFHRGRVWPD